MLSISLDYVFDDCRRRIPRNISRRVGTYIIDVNHVNLVRESKSTVHHCPAPRCRAVIATNVFESLGDFVSGDNELSPPVCSCAALSAVLIPPCIIVDFSPIYGFAVILYLT